MNCDLHSIKKPVYVKRDTRLNLYNLNIIPFDSSPYFQISQWYAKLKKKNKTCRQNLLKRYVTEISLTLPYVTEDPFSNFQSCQ